jgi:hypothetical protein
MDYIEFFKTEARTAIIPLQLKFASAVRKYFKAQSDVYVKEYLEQTEGIDQSIFQEPEKIVLKKTLEEDLEQLSEDAITVFQAFMIEAVGEGYKAVIQEMDVVGDFGIKAAHAESYARTRSAELVTNIDETTRKQINEIIQTGIVEGKDVGQVAQDIKTKFVDFSKFRTKLIASQEMGNAYEDGKFHQAEEISKEISQQMYKRSISQGDDRVTKDICLPNEAEGWIKQEELFQSGHETALFHIGCRCYVQYSTRKD